MKQILIVKPKSISEADKKLLSKMGHIVIEHEAPNEVRIVNPTDGFEGNDLLNAALSAVMSSSPVRDSFATLLIRKIQKSNPNPK